MECEQHSDIKQQMQQMCLEEQQQHYHMLQQVYIQGMGKHRCFRNQLYVVLSL